MENFEIQKKSMIKKLNPGMIMYIFIIIMIIIMIIGIIVFLVYESENKLFVKPNLHPAIHS